ncbi:glutaredoxin [candidate division KSB1 bacterium]|nr:glutaredoxin [candidate division KSB1 bacterium]
MIVAFLKDKDIQNLSKRFNTLQKQVQLVFFTQEMECQYCRETRQLLEQVSSASEKVELTVYDFQKDEDKVKEFGIDKIPAIVVLAEKDMGLRFYGIPSGYEFASLIESIDYVARKPDLSRRVQEELKKIDRDLHIQVFVTPMCPYCPEAVKTSHALAAASERVRADMIEISEFPHLANKYGIMGVPKVVVNEKFSFEGSFPELQFWDKIKKALRG